MVQNQRRPQQVIIEPDDEIVERAQAVAARLAERAHAVDQSRQVPPESVRDLHEAGLLTMCIPRVQGGTEADLVTQFSVYEIIGGACGSTAWCLGNHNAVVERIEVEGCTPRIIDEVTWQRVQDILSDPRRISRRSTGQYYALRSRTKCGLCGSAMVGQTLASKGYPYRYYRCRHAYDKNTGHDCSARYIRCERLEDTVWKEVGRVLTNPDVILHELRRQPKVKVDASEVGRLESALTSLKEQESRLVHLYTLGEVRRRRCGTKAPGSQASVWYSRSSLGR